MDKFDVVVAVDQLECSALERSLYHHTTRITATASSSRASAGGRHDLVIQQYARIMGPRVR